MATTERTSGSGDHCGCLLLPVPAPSTKSSSVSGTSWCRELPTCWAADSPPFAAFISLIFGINHSGSSRFSGTSGIGSTACGWLQNVTTMLTFDSRHHCGFSSPGFRGCPQRSSRNCPRPPSTITAATRWSQLLCGTSTGTSRCKENGRLSYCSSRSSRSATRCPPTRKIIRSQRLALMERSAKSRNCSLACSRTGCRARRHYLAFHPWRAGCFHLNPQRLGLREKNRTGRCEQCFTGWFQVTSPR